jgi:mono/diheme cytochrome c family protein
VQKLVVSFLLLVIVGFVSSRDVWGGGTPDKVAAFSGAARTKRPALPAAPEGAVSGLALKFESGGQTDSRTSRLIALNVPAGKPATPFLEPGAFKATFTGDLTLRFRMENTFSAQGRGSLKVTVNDEVVFDGSGDDLSKVESKVTKLKRGKNKLVAEYTSPKDGDAIVRLLWSSKEFMPESVPPTMLTHEPASDEALREHTRIREGRTLFATLRCTKCHAGGEPTVAAADAMAELSMDAPNLADAGSRLNAAWMTRWISDPKSVRPDASMPKVLHGDQAPQQAADIAAFLATLGAKSAEVPKATDDQAAAGARLFANLGCVGCHTIPPADATEAPLRRSLKYVKQKYQPAVLIDFLKAPEKHYAWIKMPNFRLSDDEATELSAFLFSKAEDEKGAAPAGDANRGKTLFASSGCANCHIGVIDNASKPPAFDAIAKSDWAKGCPTPSGDSNHGTAPDFGLKDDQRGALLAFAASGFDSLVRDEISEAAERQVTQLNCVACHVRDKQQDVWSTIKSEVDAFLTALPPEPPKKAESELAPDQNRPNLTYAGEKLKPEWSAKFIAGQIPYKPRPWIFARMPGFPARAELLAKGLAAQHGCTFTSPPPDKSDPELAAAGRKLAGRNGGFSCNQCHSIGEAKAHASFEAPAPNFAHVTSRLRDEFYHRWVRNPQRVEPGTRMPTFADGDGKTAIKDPFDGDAAKQYEAIRHYLLQGDAIQPAE